MSGEFWVVCYDQFRGFLSEWLDDFAIFEIKDSAKTTIEIKGSGGLCTFWLQNIRLLLKVIKSMHEAGSFHGALNARQSYAFSGQYDRLKILGIDGDLASHDEQSKSSTKVDDVRGFRKMLVDVFQTLMKTSGPPLWPEINNFFSCFDMNDSSYNTYMNRLIKHPFMMDPVGRMNYFLKLTSLSGQKYVNLHQLLSTMNFSKFVGWDVSLRACNFLLELYEYPGLEEPYDGTSAADLLRFIRNSYFNFVMCKVTLSDLDSAISQYFPNFLDMIHFGL